MLDKIISHSFYLLFFLTPLFWTSLNYELFEYNKMILTYTITVVIVGAWILKMIDQKSLILKRTPLDIPLLLFLGANILSTIFSIDHHTSIWGYYSRSNGGLLSIISYLLLYWAFVSNMDKNKVFITLKFGLASGFLISLWAIFEHFGVSLSCVILRGEFNASCWIQDVQARVFASLGQPNWLAAYLAMLIFPILYFLLNSQTTKQRVIYFTSLITMYLAFTFTYSRGPTLGLIGGMMMFIVVVLNLRISNLGELFNLVTSPNSADSSSKIKIFFKTSFAKPLLIVLLSFLFINVLFGSALTSFRLVSKFAAPSRPSIALPNSGTQLENGGTESGQIRLIVWKGALDIFKAYPFLGSGLETFAYSYYQFRPAAHNLTSEWDFLYNKAHNEYLNYLANTGLVGFSMYILVIFTFMRWSITYYVSSIHGSANKQKTHNTYYIIFTTSLLASYISYLIYNFFLFSVVIIAIFFYLFPALAFVVTDSVSIIHLPPSKSHPLFSLIHLLYKRSLKSKLTNLLYKRPFYTKLAKGFIILSILYLLSSIFKLWYADSLFAKGQRAADLGNPGRAYNLLTESLNLNPAEPFYRSELAYAAGASAAALKDTDATLSAALKNQAILETDLVLRDNPKNVSFLRSAVRTYFELSSIDKKYIDQTLKALDAAISLAPTDPKLYYNKALILDSQGKIDEEIKFLRKALELKPNYQEASKQLNEVH